MTQPPTLGLPRREEVCKDQENVLYLVIGYNNFLTIINTS